MEGRSPAQVFALVIGLTLVVAGIVGFFYNASFSTGDGTERDAVLGILDVNGWHNVVHIATGLLGILAARTLSNARLYCLVFAIVYTVVCIWGFALGGDGSILSIIPVNTEDNVLHLLLAAGGFAAYAASSPSPESGRAHPATG
jgi:Domain of unknown function (DUF4383)